MMFCKKIFISLSFFYIFAVPQIHCQEFKTVDFERLLLQHPLMKKFDKTTRRFKGTASEIKDPKQLSKKIKAQKEKLKSLKAQRKKIIISSFATPKNQSEKTWKSLKELEKQIEQLDNEIFEDSHLLTLNGVPPASKLMPEIRKLLKDTIQGMTPDEDQIVLNKLPRFKSMPPTLSKNYLKGFFNNPEKQDLKKYLKHRNAIGLLFSITSLPVITPEKEPKK